MAQTRYDILFNEDNRHQSAIRQQTTIDNLELQVRKLNKHIDDVEVDKRRFQQTEVMLRDQLLQTTIQLSSLRATFDSEINSLRPLLYEQIEHVKEDRREMLSLRTDVNLSADRFSITKDTLVDMKQELKEVKQENFALEGRAKQLEERFTTLGKENSRLERLSKVTLAAKLHADDRMNEISIHLRKKTEELTDAQVQIKTNQKEIALQKEHLFEVEQKLVETKQVADKFHVKSQAGHAEIASQEVILTKLKDKLEILESAGCTPEKQEEFEAKDRINLELQELVKKTKKQLKISLNRVYELQEEVDYLRLGDKATKEHITPQVSSDDRDHLVE